MKLRRRTKIILGGVGLIVLSGLLWLEPWAWMFGQPRIRISRETTYLTEPVRADGTIDYAAALNAKYGAGVTPENNAAVPIYEASWTKLDDAHNKKFFEVLGMAAPAKSGPYCRDLEEVAEFPLKEIVTNPERKSEFERDLDDWSEQAENRPWSAEEFPDIARWLEANRDFLEKMEQASHRTHFFVPIVMEDDETLLMQGIHILPHALGRSATLFATRAMQRILAGDIDGAIEDTLTVDRLAQLAKKGIGLDSISNANRLKNGALRASAAIAFYGHPKPKHYILLKGLAADPLQCSTVTAIDEIHRYECLDAAAALCNGRSENKARSFGQQLWFDATIDWNSALTYCNQQYDEMVAACRLLQLKERQQSIREITSKYGPLEKVFKWNQPLWFIVAGRSSRGKNWGETVCSLMMVTPDSLEVTIQRTECNRRMIGIVLALTMYREEHSAFPDKLSELLPVHIDKLPTDPFGGGEFHYERTKDGFRLYSNGPNEVDDGGKQGDNVGDDILIEFPRKPPNKNP